LVEYEDAAPREPPIIKMAGIFSNMSRRTKAFLWLFIAAIGIGAFIYFEQIAILYVVATLGIVLLLIIVAFSDLEQVGQDGPSSAPRV
jgi:hypothetical protein